MAGSQEGLNNGVQNPPSTRFVAYYLPVPHEAATTRAAQTRSQKMGKMGRAPSGSNHWFSPPSGESPRFICFYNNSGVGGWVVEDDEERGAEASLSECILRRAVGSISWFIVCSRNWRFTTISCNSPRCLRNSALFVIALPLLAGFRPSLRT